MRKLLLCMICLFVLPALGMEGTPRFETGEMAQQYDTLIHSLRCLVCQNQTIADSEAELAEDLREKVATLLKEGKTEPEVIDYFVSRFGEFIHYQPVMDERTFFLWAGPALFLFVGLVMLLYQRKPD